MGWTGHIGVMLLVLVTGAVAATLVLLIWRNGYVRGRRAARDGPSTCPGCEYNMSGLTQCRFPECGATDRSDQFWRAPIRRARDRVDREKSVTRPAISR